MNDEQLIKEAKELIAAIGERPGSSLMTMLNRLVAALEAHTLPRKNTWSVWERAAYQFGGEAAVNGRSNNLTFDDRADIGGYHTALAWSKMPVEDRNRAIDRFHQGYASEKENRKLVTPTLP